MNDKTRVFLDDCTDGDDSSLREVCRGGGVVGLERRNFIDGQWWGAMHSSPLARQ